MSRKHLIRILLSTAIISPTYVSAASPCKSAVAEIISAQGEVDIQSYRANSWRSLHNSDQICPGDTLRTDRRSRATIRLRSQSVITLDQNTTMMFSAPQDEASWFLRMIDGVSFFRSRKSQRLNVHTPFINATHEGTEFMVAVSGEKTEISVFDGQVSGANKSGKVSIGTGFKGIASANQAPHVEALKVNPEDAVQWMLYYPSIVDQVVGDASTNDSLNPALTDYRQGNVNKALDRLEQIPAAQQNIQYFNLKAALLLTVGRLDEAAPLIRQSEDLQPENSDALALSSIVAVAKNQQQVGMDLANKAVSKNPQSATAKIAQSYAFQSLFDIDNALKVTEEATKLTPENALAWARLAELQLSRGDHGAALKSAQKAQALNPKLSRTHTVLGFANLAETEINQAKQAFQEALTLDSSDPLARLGLGLAKIRQGDVEEGKTELEAAVNIDPNNGVIRSYLGKAYYELRNKDYAGKEYEIAKEMDPKDPTPYFYDAILKQTINRPVEALHDMQKAIELNDNRGVYRSKLLLDSDNAARSASLGRIYNDLGFQQRGLLEGWNSINQDLSNYSAHRLLADNYAALPRHEISRLSELLKAQLLQPVNITPVQPQAAESNILILDGLGSSITSFNEYNPLFTRDRFALQASGIFGSRDTISDEVVQSGVWDKFSYSLGQFHFQTNGFRPNNEQQKDIYNAFAQAQITADTNIQVELRRTEEKTGDINQGFFVNKFSPDKKASRETNSVRGGLHHKFSENSDLLASIVHRVEEFTNDDGGEIINFRTKGTQYELQQIYRHNKFDLTGGLNYLSDQQGNLSFTITGNRDPYLKLNNELEHGSFYLYSNIKIIPELTITAGFSQDFYRGSSAPTIGTTQTGRLDLNPLNPKFGLTWMPSKDTTLRFAAFRALKRGIIQQQTLEPTQIAGFNQFFDDRDGTLSSRIGFGIDHKFSSKIFAGAEISSRHLELPFQDIDIIINEFKKTNWGENNARAYLNWTPNDMVSLGLNYSFEELNRNDEFFDNLHNQFSFFSQLETHKTQLFGNFFHPSGFISKVSLAYVDQSIDFLSFEDFLMHPESSRFWLLDAEMGYRLPKRRGLITLGIKNLLDERYNFQGSDLNSPMPVQGRYLFSRITLSF